MLNLIIKLFFDKKSPKSKITVIKKRREQNIARNISNKLNREQYKNTQKEETCLSKYFEKNKGLNYYERFYAN